MPIAPLKSTLSKKESSIAITPFLVKLAPVNKGEFACNAGLKVTSEKGFSSLAAAGLPFSIRLLYGPFVIQLASIPGGGVPPAKFSHEPLMPYHAQ